MADAERFFIPAQPIEVSTEVKRSRFIAHIAHGQSAEQAFHIIDQAKKRYPDARHHCWAFIACSPFSSSAVRFSDAGEPSGTAGKPILNVLQHSHYGEIVCVVSRYFGGIKLGAGGLVRAYSNSAQAALEQLSVQEKIPLSQVTIKLPYPFEASVRHYLDSVDAAINNVSYEEQVIFQLSVARDLQAQMLLQTSNLCKGNVTVMTTEPDSDRMKTNHLES